MVVTTEGVAFDSSWVEAGDAGKHPTMHRGTPATMNYLALDMTLKRHS